MLESARQWLVPPDGVERHVLTARLLGAPRTVLDVGGISGHLVEHLPGASTTAINVDPNADVVIEPGPQALPFPDRSFEAVASLDTLEHIPRADRALFVSELLRVASDRVVLCCPHGTDARRGIEEADNAWYRELTGADHPWISEHLEHGVPTQPELAELFAEGSYTTSYRFAGDARKTSLQLRLAETANVRRRPADIARWVAFRATHRPDLKLSTQPSAFANRVFVIAIRDAAKG